MDESRITRDIAEETISAGFDNLHARLVRIGYTPKALATLADAGLPIESGMPIIAAHTVDRDQPLEYQWSM